MESNLKQTRYCVHLITDIPACVKHTENLDSETQVWVCSM